MTFVISALGTAHISFAGEEVNGKKSPLDKLAEQIRNPETRNDPVPQDIKDEYQEWLKAQNSGIREELEPPWVVKSEWDRDHPGWRMGGGEDYMNDFQIWFSALSDEKFSEYVRQYPEVGSWVGFYEQFRP
ncbi:hypothetical protein [Pacificoceanicola onchidii]|uniref:hypothetical protein n=1 Tax=Pacificoceanicola onchidii TaxID=2562685 RepID=UPI001455EF27|nr:hypothetical protein [Pacificoceanicola onchidii]